MVTKEMYEKLATLAVERGVNVQKGQYVVIGANVRDYEFACMCAEKAYDRGAEKVILNWSCEALSRMRYERQSIDALSYVPQWEYDRSKDEQDHKACYLDIVSEEPGYFKGVDPEKIQTAAVAFGKKMHDLQAYTMNNIGQWSIVGLPSAGWAKKVFPDLPEEEAFRKLEEALFHVTRVEADNDPLQAWEEHDNELIEHAGILNDYNFKELHFTSELGTDLTVGLVKDHVWCGGGDWTPQGVFFDPNLPTEEVFCMPCRDHVDGKVCASMPLNYNGNLIEGFELTFRDGEVVSYHAEKGEESLEKLLSFDEGSKRLGEVALVPFTSPIRQTGILFLNTLYDENAACHLALGMPYPENLKGGVEMSEEELKEHGANESDQHVDFMFGTEHMNIDGITYEGEIIPIFREGCFVIRRKG